MKSIKRKVAVFVVVMASTLFGNVGYAASNQDVSEDLSASKALQMALDSMDTSMFTANPAEKAQFDAFVASAKEAAKKMDQLIADMKNQFAQVQQGHGVSEPAQQVDGSAQQEGGSDLSEVQGLVIVDHSS